MCGVGEGDEHNTRTSNHKWQGEPSQGHKYGPNGGSGEDRQHGGKTSPEPRAVAARECRISGDGGERQREHSRGEIRHRQPSHGGIA